MHWHATAPQRWAAEGLAALLHGAGHTVSVGELAEPAPPPCDAVLALVPTREAAEALQRRLPAGLPLLLLAPGPQALQPVGPARALGLLQADAPTAQVLAAAAALAAGLHVRDWSAGFVAPPRAPEPLDPPTPRELEVLELMAKGLGNRDIAAALGITAHTAKFHVAQILDKTGSASRTEAVRLALQQGWVGL